MEDRRGLAELLAEKGVHLKRLNPGTSQVTTCPKCSHTRKKKTDPCLSVKLDEDQGAVLHCHHCGWTDNVPGMRSRSGVRASSGPPPRKVVKPPAAGTVIRGEKIAQAAASRMVSAEVAERFGLYVTKQWFPQTERDEWCLAFPYRFRGEVVNHKYRTPGKHFRQDKDAERSIYNIDALQDNDAAVWCEGEWDVLACEEAGITNAISLPDGAPKKLKEEMDEHDKRFEPLTVCEAELKPITKFIIATDGDGPGDNLAEELARRLGKEKCWRVRWPDGCKDANDVLKALGPEELRRCIAEAEPYPINGIFLLPYGMLDRLFERAPNKAFSISRFPRFSEHHKVVPGCLSIITGTPNSGKTPFVDQIMVEMAMEHRWKWAVCSMENDMDEHASELAEKYIGQPFRGTLNWAAMDRYQRARAEAFIRAHFVFLRQDDPHQPVTTEFVIEKARAAVYRYGVQGLVIDPFSRLDDDRRNEREDLHVRDVLAKVDRLTKVCELATYFIAHPTKMQADPKTGKITPPNLYSISGGAHWNNFADQGGTVHRPDRASLVTEYYPTKARKKWMGKIPAQPIRFLWDPATGRYSEEDGYSGADAMTM